VGRAHARIHYLLQRKRGFASWYACADCDRQATQWSYAGKRGDEPMPYSEDLSEYTPRCGQCHWAYDHPESWAEEGGPPHSRARELLAEPTWT
jgi:hypothetical protein